MHEIESWVAVLAGWLITFSAPLAISILWRRLHDHNTQTFLINNYTVIVASLWAQRCHFSFLWNDVYWIKLYDAYDLIFMMIVEKVINSFIVCSILHIHL